MTRAIRVLIAEDETIIRLDLRGLLEEAGVEVCGEARDGLEAVALVRELDPDVVVMDVKMPRLDGIEAARRIAEEHPVPIVMLTAYGEEELVARAVAAGVYGYLTKPFRATDLLPALTTAIARHRDLEGARELPARPLELVVPSRGGGGYPLRFQRRPDGSLDVSIQNEEDGR